MNWRRSVFPLVVAAGVLAQGQTGRIGGVVVDEAGKPVDLAYVTYLRTPYSRTDSVPAGGGTLAGLDGAFGFGNLTAGKYLLCVQTAPQRGYVEPCEWTLEPRAVVLKTGENVPGVRLVLERGTRIEVRVKDPKRLLPNATRGLGSGFFEVGVAGENGMQHAAKLVAQDREGAEYVVVAPRQRAVRVVLRGSNHKVVDDKNRPIGAEDARLQIRADNREEKIRIEVEVDAERAK